MEHVDEVRVYDVVKERATHTFTDALDCDLIFVCLPTPQESETMKCNVSYIHKFFKEDAKYDRTANYVLRSTVPIGTTRSISIAYDIPNLVHCPEFLTARCAMTDIQIPARNIVGVPNHKGVGESVEIDKYELRNALEECRGGPPYHDHPLRSLLIKRFPGVPLLLMSSDESEAVKLGLNSFFAVKVAYFNELYSLCANLGLNWEKVRAGILSDGRIAHAHTAVPGPDGKFGYGGTCLPKDVASLAHQLLTNELRADMTAGAYLRNEEDRKR